MAELPLWAKQTLRTDFWADCTFFCGDTPLFAPANADAQNARKIATLAHQIDQPHNPPGRVVVVIPQMCAFSPGRTTKIRLTIFTGPRSCMHRLDKTSPVSACSWSGVRDSGVILNSATVFQLFASQLPASLTTDHRLLTTDHGPRTTLKAFPHLSLFFLSHTWKICPLPGSELNAVGRG